LGGVTIRAFRAVDYAASTFTLRGKVITDDNGEWAPLYLTSGTVYTLVYSHPSQTTVTAEVTP
jgi:hypothetical protein